MRSDRHTSLKEGGIPVLSGCKALNATKVYGSSLKLKFYCSSGSIRTFKDDSFIAAIKV